MSSDWWWFCSQDTKQRTNNMQRIWCRRAQKHWRSTTQKKKESKGNKTLSPYCSGHCYALLIFTVWFIGVASRGTYGKASEHTSQASLNLSVELVAAEEEIKFEVTRQAWNLPPGRLKVCIICYNTRILLSPHPKPHLKFPLVAHYHLLLKKEVYKLPLQ